MPQPGMNGMEPVFGEAYGGHRGLLSPCPLAMSPQGGRTEYDQLLMLGSQAFSRKRPFELLSDLVDDGGFGEDQHTERWDVSALDEMTRYTKLGLGVGGDLLASSEEAVLMGRWGRSLEEQDKEEEEKKMNGCTSAPPVSQEVQVSAARKDGGCVSIPTATSREVCTAGSRAEERQDGLSGETTVEVYQVAQEEEETVAVAAAGLTLEHCSEEHNYSLSQGEEVEAGPAHNSQSEEVLAAKTHLEVQCSEESHSQTELEDEEQDEEDGAEETTVEAELSSSSDTECDEPSDRQVRFGWQSGGTLDFRFMGVIYSLPAEPGHCRHTALRVSCTPLIHITSKVFPGQQQGKDRLARLEKGYQHEGNITMYAVITHHGVIHHHATLGPSNTAHLIIFLDTLHNTLLPPDQIDGPEQLRQKVYDLNSQTRILARDFNNGTLADDIPSPPSF
ncbi:uncharacterized protein LOC119422507 [Nematolebias whitei]|uniref:uncharacterized protein LOC119422507 n=1 Tax=Nematolebias whitei TaxID=451745 RepID=UPI001897EF94|nr:uncharacterized protein LOC119422507 [Nematolebias whitei]